MSEMTAPAMSTDKKYAAGAAHEGTGEARKSAETPLIRSWIMVPQAQRGTVMQVVAITPESIQLSLKARTASSAVTPNSASAAAMPSDCIRPIKSTYSPSTMSGESSEKKTFALSRKNTFKLRMVSAQSAVVISSLLLTICP